MAAQAPARAGEVGDFPEGSITGLTLSGKEIVVVCREGEYFAFPDRCTHARFPLSDGELVGETIQCIRHGATFNLRTGRPTLPAIRALKMFETRVEDGELFVVL